MNLLESKQGSTNHCPVSNTAFDLTEPCTSTRCEACANCLFWTYPYVFWSRSTAPESLVPLCYCFPQDGSYFVSNWTPLGPMPPEGDRRVPIEASGVLFVQNFSGATASKLSPQ